MLKTFIVNGFKFDFVGNWKSTRNGFAHYGDIYIGNSKKGHYQVNYLNRTWECYPYQTLFYCLIDNLINDRLKTLKDDFKYENKISRLTAKTREKLDTIIADDALLYTYKLAREQL